MELAFLKFDNWEFTALMFNYWEFTALVSNYWEFTALMSGYLVLDFYVLYLFFSEPNIISFEQL